MHYNHDSYEGQEEEHQSFSRLNIIVIKRGLKGLKIDVKMMGRNSW